MGSVMGGKRHQQRREQDKNFHDDVHGAHGAAGTGPFASEFVHRLT